MEDTGVVLFIVGFVAAIFAFFIWLYGRIAAKAGYSRWWSVAMLIPVVGIVVIWVFAFADWPNLASRPEDAQFRT